MISPVFTQFNLLVYSLLAGVLTGILFDFYRVLRGLEAPNRVITFIEDTLFWILTSIIVFIFLLRTNYAYLREYVFISIALGIILYMWILSKYFIKLEYRFARSITLFIRVTFKYIVYPFLLIFYKLKRKNRQKILKKNLEEN